MWEQEKRGQGNDAHILITSKSESRSVVSNSLQPYGLYSPWNSPGQNTGVGSLSLLQGIFPTQGSNPGLLHCRQILYCLSHKESPRRSNSCFKIVAFIEGFPWARSCLRRVTHSFLTAALVGSGLSPFYRWGSWGTERWSHLCVVMPGTFKFFPLFVKWAMC